MFFFPALARNPTLHHISSPSGQALRAAQDPQNPPRLGTWGLAQHRPLGTQSQNSRWVPGPLTSFPEQQTKPSYPISN